MRRKGIPARWAKRRPAGCARSPGADKGVATADLVEPDRHPRAQPANEARGKAGFGLGERPRPGVFGRSGLPVGPPLGGEVAVEVDPAPFSLFAAALPSGLRLGTTKTFASGSGQPPPTARRSARRALVAVDAGEDEHAAAEARVAVLAQLDRAPFQRPADHPAPLDQVAREARRRGEGEEVRRRRGRRFVPSHQPVRRPPTAAAPCAGRRGPIPASGGRRRGGEPAAIEAQLQQVGAVQPLESRQVDAEEAPADGVEREQEGQLHVAVVEGVGPAPVRARRAADRQPGKLAPAVARGQWSRREPAAAGVEGPQVEVIRAAVMCRAAVARPVVPQVELRAVRRDRLEGEVTRQAQVADRVLRAVLSRPARVAQVDVGVEDRELRRRRRVGAGEVDQRQRLAVGGEPTGAAVVGDRGDDVVAPQVPPAIDRAVAHVDALDDRQRRLGPRVDGDVAVGGAILLGDDSLCGADRADLLGG